MTERRLVQSIHTREVIPTSLAGDDACYLVAVTGDQIEILSNLMNYAHRRINWCDEVIDAGRYYLPNDADWNDLQALVADLEYRLMDTCNMADLIAAIEALCGCVTYAQSVTPGPLASAALGDGLEDGSIVYPEPVLLLYGDADACAAAQTLWSMVYEYVSEIAIPLANGVFEIVVPATLALLNSWGVAVQILVSFGLTIEMLQELLQASMDANGVNTLNWLVAQKHEIVCAAYNAYRSEPTVMDTVVDLVNSSDLTFNVKPFISLAFRVFGRTAQLFKYTDWAVDRQISGYCDDCDLPEGCFDFCDEGWTITPEWAILTEPECYITMQGETSSHTGALRSIDVEHAHVQVFIDPPAIEPPFNALQIRLENAAHETETWVIGVTGTDPTLYVHDFALDNPTSLEVLNVAGTATVVFYLCVSEA